jgi:hypothetical protein
MKETLSPKQFLGFSKKKLRTHLPNLGLVPLLASMAF